MPEQTSGKRESKAAEDVKPKIVARTRVNCP